MNSADIMRQMDNLKREQMSNNTRIAQEQRSVDNYERQANEYKRQANEIFVVLIKGVIGAWKKK